MEWINDQAERAKVRQDKYGQQYTSNGSKSPVRKSTGRVIDLSLARSPKRESNFSQSAKDDEEELAYLNFVTAVTNDILDKGVFTNRVLNQIIDHHIERNRSLLKMSHLNEHIDDLRSKLGIAKTSDEEDPLSSLDRFRYYPEYQPECQADYDIYSATKSDKDMVSYKDENLSCGEVKYECLAEPILSNDNMNDSLNRTDKADLDFVDGSINVHQTRIRKDSVEEEAYDITATLQAALKESDRHIDEDESEVAVGQHNAASKGCEDLNSTTDSHCAMFNTTLGTNMLETMMANQTINNTGEIRLDESTSFVNEDTKGKTVHFANYTDVYSPSITEVSTINNTGFTSDLNSSFDTSMMREALLPEDNIPVKCDYNISS